MTQRHIQVADRATLPSIAYLTTGPKPNPYFLEPQNISISTLFYCKLYSLSEEYLTLVFIQLVCLRNTQLVSQSHIELFAITFYSASPQTNNFISFVICFFRVEFCFISFNLDLIVWMLKLIGRSATFSIIILFT